MQAFDLERMLLNDLSIGFLAEVVLRVLLSYAAVFAFLKFSGRRGIRQLSMFELVVILVLGSSAGDVALYEDVPLLTVAAVFMTLIVIYRLTTHAMARSRRLACWIEGDPVILIKDGHYEIDSLNLLNISEDEFFMELRQENVEHIGQVRLAILEVDGDVSLYFYDATEVRPGLSVLPPALRPVFDVVPCDDVYACVRCGTTHAIAAQQSMTCERCGRKRWSTALRSARTA